MEETCEIITNFDSENKEKQTQPQIKVKRKRQNQRKRYQRKAKNAQWLTGVVDRLEKLNVRQLEIIFEDAELLVKFLDTAEPNSSSKMDAQKFCDLLQFELKTDVLKWHEDRRKLFRDLLFLQKYPLQSPSSLQYPRTKSIVVEKLKNRLSFIGVVLADSALQKHDLEGTLHASLNVIDFPDNVDALQCIYRDKIVFAAVRNTFSAEYCKHYQAQLEQSFRAHPDLKRGKSHMSFGKMHACSGMRMDFLTGKLGPYSSLIKEPEAIRAELHNAGVMRKRLFYRAAHVFPFATKNYEDFVQVGGEIDDKILQSTEKATFISQQFVTQNYQAAIHYDNDRSMYAIAYCAQDDADIIGGNFCMPEYGFMFPLRNNCLWCFKTTVLHGTARLQAKTPRITSVFSITEKSAKCYEKTLQQKK